MKGWNGEWRMEKGGKNTIDEKTLSIPKPIFHLQNWHPKETFSMCFLIFIYRLR